MWDNREAWMRFASSLLDTVAWEEPWELSQAEFFLYHIHSNGLSLEPFYRAMAELCGFPQPAGHFDEEYGNNNLPYLLSSWYESSSVEDWAYRLYVCFDGPAPEIAQTQWHCVPSYRFVSDYDESERFDYLERHDNPRAERLHLTRRIAANKA